MTGNVYSFVVYVRMAILEQCRSGLCECAESLFRCLGLYAVTSNSIIYTSPCGKICNYKPSTSSLLLQCFDELLRWLLSVSLRVILRPPPQIVAGILERSLRLPAKLLVRACWVGRQIEDVSRSSTNDFVWKVPANRMTERLDHVVNRAALAGSQIPGPNSRVVASQMVQSNQVAFCKVENVDVVANGRSVFRGVV